MEREAKNAGFGLDDFSVPSLSSRTIVYKGMFVASQFSSFYPDLADPEFSSPFAVVHQRYSTNTFPSWPLAQPFRMIAHNGEINTLRKNVNAMKARQSTLESPLFGKALHKLFPVLQEEGSDSAMFDNVFELLVRAGRSPEHAFLMMVPEPWGRNDPDPRRAFYEYHSAVMESWDGPAAMVFCDGATLGAASDRNGLRPFRYVRTRDGRFIGASEAGALEVEESLVLEKGKLEPGRMLLADFRSGELLDDGRVKSAVFRGAPYAEWLAENRIELSGLPEPDSPAAVRTGGGGARARAFGYFGFDARADRVLGPMILTGREGGAAMGTRRPPAILSGRPESLFSYFRQIFAQVTNPPIDPVREGAAMTLESYIGRERNLLEESPRHCRQLRLPHPLLTNREVERLRAGGLEDFRVCTVSLAFSLSDQGQATLPAPGSRLKAAVDAICTAVELRVDEGYSLVILSDREVDEGRASVPALLALAAVNRRLVESGKRHRTGLVVETGEAREIHHVSLLVGYGASAVNPWLVFEGMPELAARCAPPGCAAPDPEECSANYVEAVKKGILKTMSKMGISSISSYRGGGIFEALGLSRTFVEAYFPGTESRVGGAGLAEIEADVTVRHKEAYGPGGREKNPALAGAPGAADPSVQAEVPWPPGLAALLAKAARRDDEGAYREYAGGISSSSRPPFALRDLFEFKTRDPIPLSRVQSVQDIVSRFSVAAMSCGALSPEAHEALAAGANSAGAWSCSGEGGEDPERDRPGPGGVSRASASRQVASARFGVTARYLASARELQIKIAQGAKPGEGGQLPGAKVDGYIARLRHASPGTTLISPPPHHDIYSIEDLSQLVHDLRCVNPSARISVKLAAQAGIGAVAAGTAKAGADCVIVSSGDGGTGAAPLSSLDYTGNAWETSLPEIRQVLAMNGMGDRVSVQVDGRLRSGRDVVIAAILGAHEFAFGTAALISLGCVACGQCDRGVCPAGIATQRAELRARFSGKPEHVARFLRFAARETRDILASLGMGSLDEASGRYDLLDFRGRGRDGRGGCLDFSGVVQALELAKRHLILETEGGEGSESLALPPPPAGLAAFENARRPPFPAPALDEKLIEPVCRAFSSGTAFKAEYPIRNSDRSTGAALSGELTRRGFTLAPGSARVRFKGSAGQSFGAFLVTGLSFELEGEANDFVGKGLSGGRIAIRPPAGAGFAPEDNVIAGNVCLMGATSGELYRNGRAGERFAIRNSGAVAVAEGVGDHGCEYMTGGRVVVLGGTGTNFGAGMSGGTAYILDLDGLAALRVDSESVSVAALVDSEDEFVLREDIERHRAATKSPRAAALLDDWETFLKRFVKVFPGGRDPSSRGAA